MRYEEIQGFADFVARPFLRLNVDSSVTGNTPTATVEGNFGSNVKYICSTLS